MKKGFITLLVLLMFSVMGCKSGSSDVIKLGFVGPLTGDHANYGKMMTQAVRIAIEEKNAAGGINGKTIELVAEDSEGKEDKANAVITKLATIDKVYGIVGGVFSSVSNAIAPIANMEKIVMISPSSTHKDLTSKGEFIFRTVVNDQLQAAVFAKYVKEKMGIDNVAILYIKNDYSQGLTNDFTEVYENAGGKVVATESGLQGDKDFKTQLTKIRSTDAEAIYIPNYVSEIAQIIGQVKQLGMDIKILSADGFSNPEIFDLAGEDANGVIFSNSPEEDSAEGNDIKAEFVKKYEAQWGEKPDSFSINSYDAANIIIDAIEYSVENADGAIDRDVMQKYVSTIEDFPGASGSVTFTSIGDVVKNIGIFESIDGDYVQKEIYTLIDGNLIQVK